ncbi:MAG TPA: hypothetical protein VMS55_07580 [Myxococcota bacterium]|nr:hypothetical protein [Myxococcota bacterium]
MVEGQAPLRTAMGLRIAAAVAVWLLGGAASAQAPCEPWPEEPRPLPTVLDTDPTQARWATLRIRELSAAAIALDPDDPARARSIWAHAACLAPGDADLERRSRAPLPAVTVHRPELLRGEVLLAGHDPWRSLSAPVAVSGPPQPARVARAPAPSPGPSPAAADALVAETEANVRAARFDAALSSAERARRELTGLQRAQRAPRTAQLEVWAATAELALGRDDEAYASLRRALDAEPSLKLDAETSPKVRRALDAVRQGQGR